VVVDSSALVDYVLGPSDRSTWVEEQFDACTWTLRAPHLVDVEVLSALRRLVGRGVVGPGLGRRAMTIQAELPITRYSHVPLLDRMWQLRQYITAGDAAYVALAEAVDEPLLTTDVRLGRAHGLRISIHSFAP
jgi:predicted nucleic acid-binding protein